MNQYIEIRFFRNGKRLKVKRQLRGGLEFDESDPIERTVGIGVTHCNEATRVRLDNIRRIQGWPPSKTIAAIAEHIAEDIVKALP